MLTPRRGGIKGVIKAFLNGCELHGRVFQVVYAHDEEVTIKDKDSGFFTIAHTRLQRLLLHTLDYRERRHGRLSQQWQDSLCSKPRCAQHKSAGAAMPVRRRVQVARQSLESGVACSCCPQHGPADSHDCPHPIPSPLELEAVEGLDEAEPALGTRHDLSSSTWHNRLHSTWAMALSPSHDPRTAAAAAATSSAAAHVAACRDATGGTRSGAESRPLERAAHRTMRSWQIDSLTTLSAR